MILTIISGFVLKLGLEFQNHKKACVEIVSLFFQQTTHASVDFGHISFQNGHLCLTTLTLKPPGPEILSIGYIQQDFPLTQHINSQNFPTPIFDGFLQANFESDAIEAIYAFIQHTLIGQTSDQTFLFLVGVGGTGKSTLINILHSLVSSQCVLSTSFHQIGSQLAQLSDKRLVIMQEVPNKAIDLGILKSITGGETFSVDDKKRGTLNIIVRCHVVCASNHFPNMPDSSGSFQRRMKLLAMNKKPNLGQRQVLLHQTDLDVWTGPLLKELPGIIVKAMQIKNAHDVLANTKIQSQDKALDSWRLLINPIESWLSSCVIIVSDLSVCTPVGHSCEQMNSVKLATYANRTLMASQTHFFKQHGLKPIGLNAFSNKLIEALLIHDDPNAQQVFKRRKEAGYYFFGLKLVSSQYNADGYAEAETEADFEAESNTKTNGNQKNHNQADFDVKADATNADPKNQAVLSLKSLENQAPSNPKIDLEYWQNQAPDNASVKILDYELTPEQLEQWKQKQQWKRLRLKPQSPNQKKTNVALWANDHLVAVDDYKTIVPLGSIKGTNPELVMKVLQPQNSLHWSYCNWCITRSMQPILIGLKDLLDKHLEGKHKIEHNRPHVGVVFHGLKLKMSGEQQLEANKKTILALIETPRD